MRDLVPMPIHTCEIMQPRATIVDRCQYIVLNRRNVSLSVEWAPLEDAFDRCSIGNGDKMRFYSVMKGSGNEWRNLMKKQGKNDKK